jgi:hypothetical protein
MAMEAMKTGRFAATGMTALSWDRGVPDPVSGTLEHLSPMSLAIGDNVRDNAPKHRGTQQMLDDGVSAHQGRQKSPD